MYKSKLKSGIVGLRKSIKGHQRIDLSTATQEQLEILYDTGHKFVIKTKDDVQTKQKK